MKRTLLVLGIATLCLRPGVSGQNGSSSLKDFTWTLPGELALGLVHLNDTTTPMIFQPPTLYSIRARARSNTVFYVQGTADKNVQIDTTSFTIEQNGETTTSIPTNIKHFEKGKIAVPKGERIEGVLTFARLVDASRPFTVKHGADSVQIKFNPDQMKAIMPAAEPK